MTTQSRRAAAIAAVLLTSTGLSTQLPASASKAATTPVTRNVAVTDQGYRPTALTVHAGTKVVWTFKGRHGHNVTVDTGPVSFKSPTKSSGTFAKTLTK